MISLKELASAMVPDTKVFVDDRSKVGAAVETTTGKVWFELATTGIDFKVDFISPHRDYLVVTVSPMEEGGAA